MSLSRREKMSDKMRIAFYEEYEEELFQLNFKNDIEYQKTEVKKLVNMLISSNYLKKKE
jgi:phosphosulfolactate phosphohydrolase-like enzyme